jgi:hypothetical protein
MPLSLTSFPRERETLSEGACCLALRHGRLRWRNKLCQNDEMWTLTHVHLHDRKRGAHHVTDACQRLRRRFEVRI